MHYVIWTDVCLHVTQECMSLTGQNYVMCKLIIEIINYCSFVGNSMNVTAFVKNIENRLISPLLVIFFDFMQSNWLHEQMALCYT